MEMENEFHGFHCQGNSGLLLFGEAGISLDFTNLLNMAVGMSGDFEHPLPAINRFFSSEAVRAQIVLRRFDVLNHRGSQRLEFGESFAELLVGIDFFVSAA